MIDETLEELKASVSRVHEGLKRELGKLRTGRASPGLLDAIRVDYYGAMTSIGRLATVSVPEARLLVVKPFDRSQVKAVEKAILESELGLQPQTEGEIIRIPIPLLTEERRKELVKIARRYGEEAKVNIRKSRHEAKDLLEQLEREGEASADDVERAKKKLEEIVQNASNHVDEVIGRKEADILAV